LYSGKKREERSAQALKRINIAKGMNASPAKIKRYFLS
tara:strand:+ start:587 stop:700 length:114 start_codon:yes stop_codon:yes gene_type:complete